MDQVYDITFGDRTVGTAQVCREGLYYRIRCRCAISGEVLCQVLVRCGDRETSLGVLVPMEDRFGLETRIPVKRVGEGSLTFRGAPRHRTIQGTFIPLCPEEPFRYISRLKDAYLERRNGQTGVVIKELGCG